MSGVIVRLSDWRGRRERKRAHDEYEARQNEARRIASERLHRLLCGDPPPPGAA